MAMTRALNQAHGSTTDLLELLDCIRYQVLEIRGLTVPENELSKYSSPRVYIYPVEKAPLMVFTYKAR